MQGQNKFPAVFRQGKQEIVPPIDLKNHFKSVLEEQFYTLMVQRQELEWIVSLSSRAFSNSTA